LIGGEVTRSDITSGRSGAIGRLDLPEGRELKEEEEEEIDRK